MDTEDSDTRRQQGRGGDARINAAFKNMLMVAHGGNLHGNKGSDIHVQF
jgi:hypothetical protein